VFRYIINRLLSTLLVLLGASLVVFLAARLVPGDVVEVMLGTEASPERVAELRRVFGLDQPLPLQYLSWLGGVLRGELGRSLRTGNSVAGEILTRLPVTLELTIFALFFSLLISLPTGIISAVKENTTSDYILNTLALIGLSIPDFWLGTLLILFASFYLPWLYTASFRRLWVDPVSNIRSMILPALSLGIAMAAVVMRMIRSSLREVLEQDYIRTARAKGVKELDVIRHHALRNASINVITIIGLQAGYLLGGAVIIEMVFSLPGIGRLALDAALQRDYPMIQGTALFITALFSLVNLGVDILYAYLDPTIRIGE